LFRSIRRFLAGTIKATGPAEFVALCCAFMTTAASGAYGAYYRGETVGIEPADEAAYTALAA